MNIPADGLIVAQLRTRDACESLLLAYFKQDTRDYWTKTSIEQLTKAASALGFTIQPIPAPAADPVPATVEAAE